MRSFSSIVNLMSLPVFLSSTQYSPSSGSQSSLPDLDATSDFFVSAIANTDGLGIVAVYLLDNAANDLGEKAPTFPDAQRSAVATRATKGAMTFEDARKGLIEGKKVALDHYLVWLFSSSSCFVVETPDQNNQQLL
jgi:hypothetical protein